MESLINPPWRFRLQILIRLFLLSSKLIVLTSLFLLENSISTLLFSFFFTLNIKKNFISNSSIFYFESPPRKIENALVVDNLRILHHIAMPQQTQFFCLSDEIKILKSLTSQPWSHPKNDGFEYEKRHPTMSEHFQFYSG